MKTLRIVFMISLLAAICGTMILLVTWLEISGLLACHVPQNHLFWSTTTKKSAKGRSFRFFQCELENGPFGMDSCNTSQESGLHDRVHWFRSILSNKKPTVHFSPIKTQRAAFPAPRAFPLGGQSILRWSFCHVLSGFLGNTTVSLFEFSSWEPQTVSL